MAENKKKVTPIVIEGFEINPPNMTFWKLQEFSLTMFERLLVQRKERNKLMMERDKLLTILTNLRHEIRVAEAAAVNTEAEIEAAEASHRQEVKEVEQEVKWLEYDHKMNLEHLKAWENGLLSKIDEDNFQETVQLLQEKHRLKVELSELEAKYLEHMQHLKAQHAQEVAEMKAKQEASLIEKEIEFRRGLMELKEEMTLRHEMEMSEIEERKNCHLMELRSIHKRRLAEFKNFFNTVASENLAVINALKQSLDGIQKNKEAMKDEMALLIKTNKRLQIPLEKSRAEVKDLTRQLINYEKDLTSLKHNKRILENTKEELLKISLNSRDMLRTLMKDDSEVPEKTGCVNSIIRFRNYAFNKRKQMEDIIDNLLQDLKKKQCMIKSLSADPAVAQMITDINFEYWSPFSIHIEVEAVKTAYDELLAALEKKLMDFCIPESMTGHGPWRPKPEYGPAGLVSKQ